LICQMEITNYICESLLLFKGYKNPVSKILFLLLLTYVIEYYYA
jgi:hypothetical protein